MPNKDLTYPLIAGLLASVLFLLDLSVGLNFLLMFLPTLPLFAVGLSRQPQAALTASLFAAGVIAVIADLPASILFLILLGIPAWCIATQSLRWRDSADGPPREWFPIGVILLYLTLGACVMVALMTWYYSGEPGGLPKMLSRNIHEAFADFKDDYGDMIDTLASQWSFLMFSTAIWLWGIALYAHAWLANRALVRRNRAIRPDFSVESFAMPNWTLSLLAICALASLIGSASMSFLGKSTLISLLLPYFFLGSALLRRFSQKWPNRRFFLFIIYFMAFAQFWPALAIAGIGLWHHIKHLSGAGSSYKS